MTPREGAGSDGIPEGPEWRRLDRRTVLVTAAVLTGVASGGAVPAVLALSTALPWWRAAAWVLVGAVLLVACGTVADHVRWRRTRYRIGAERAELRTGLLLVKRRSLARARIRTVDLTAHPLLRVLGLVRVRIGTGENTGGGESTLALDPVTRAEGERLRRVLLAHTVRDGVDGRHDGLLATLDPRWIRYAPVSFLAPLLGCAAAGGVLQVSEWFGAQAAVIEWAGERFEDASLLWAIVVLVLLATAVGAVGALGLWTGMWWNHRLEREPGGTLRVRRGLFTTRSVSIEERRLRGVEIVEPLGVRLCRAARVDAVATGLTHDDGDRHGEHKTLLPPAPRAIADRVAAQVLREPVSPTSAPLIGHPRAARARRLRRALGGVLLPVAVLTVLGASVASGLLDVALLCALAGVPLAVLLALDAYRGLGHGVSGAYLVTRSGSLRRGTVALRRDGVIGWTVRQTYFQRRAGLLTLTATTAAGSGAYAVLDTGEGEGLAFADAAVPGLLGPFLEPVPPTKAPPATTEARPTER
ncbi:PH domain-containing protein [Streptomyces sp. NPDC048577]|uniref:PH domain-containing protein n=1 Tax=Streptomyces sp. NPDC048577 TaxID=3157209 RepID=UPI003432D4BC